jgi:hypothetical protein
MSQLILTMPTLDDGSVPLRPTHPINLSVNGTQLQVSSNVNCILIVCNTSQSINISVCKHFSPTSAKTGDSHEVLALSDSISR